MKLHKNSKGFGITGILIVLVMIGVVGAVGWYVSNHKSEKPDDEPTSDSQLENQETDDNRLPVGFVEYANTELGVTFGYPEDWGIATLAETAESNHLIRGNEFIVSFSQNKDITAGLVSAETEHDPNIGGHGGVADAVSFLRYDVKEQVPSSLYVEHFRDETSTLFTLGYGAYECEGVASILIRKLENNATYKSIAFMYINARAQPEQPSESLCESYKDYVNQDVIDRLKLIKDTVNTSG